MAIRTMSRVWDHSNLGGTELLLLLAIADFANDDGVAWPSVGTLAKKIRMSERNTYYLLAKIAKTGELTIETNKGPRGCNLFRVHVLQGEKIAPLKPVAGTPEAGSSRPLKPTAPEPPVNHKRTTRAISSPDPLPCPAETIIEAYHRLMPGNPRCKVLNPSRRGTIKARWDEAAKLTCKPFGYSTIPGGVTAWETFFATCAESDFLTGKARPQPGRPPFFADIDFLMAPSKFARCLENFYHRDAQSSPMAGAI
ncbi:MAG: helix-turn-helix domain-containing protein [Sterolibacterium sp.]|nr:helix-turn-helix domain-containing protein [Sterolibacterium sp.]